MWAIYYCQILHLNKFDIYFYLFHLGKDVGDHCSDSQAACKALCVNIIHILGAGLDFRVLADKLLSIDIITDDDWKHVNDRDSGQTALERMRHLFDLIMATVKKNGSVFDQFIDILRDGSQRERDLADRLITSYEGKVYVFWYQLQL